MRRSEVEKRKKHAQNKAVFLYFSNVIVYVSVIIGMVVFIMVLAKINMEIIGLFLLSTYFIAIYLTYRGFKIVFFFLLISIVVFLVYILK